jgi:hypothetical protein
MMKKIICFSILLMGIVSLTFAQMKTPVVGYGAIKFSSQNSIVNTPTHTFNVQLRKSMNEINKDTKLGKLTKTQALTAREQIRNIRIQELQFFKENGSKQLTSVQLTQLNQSLAQISTSL